MNFWKWMILINNWTWAAVDNYNYVFKCDGIKWVSQSSVDNVHQWHNVRSMSYQCDKRRRCRSRDTAHVVNWPIAIFSILRILIHSCKIYNHDMSNTFNYDFLNDLNYIKFNEDEWITAWLLFENDGNRIII